MYQVKKYQNDNWVDAGRFDEEWLALRKALEELKEGATVKVINEEDGSVVASYQGE